MLYYITISWAYDVIPKTTETFRSVLLHVL